MANPSSKIKSSAQLSQFSAIFSGSSPNNSKQNYFIKKNLREHAKGKRGAKMQLIYIAGVMISLKSFAWLTWLSKKKLLAAFNHLSFGVKVHWYLRLKNIFFGAV